MCMAACRRHVIRGHTQLATRMPAQQQPATSHMAAACLYVQARFVVGRLRMPSAMKVQEPQKVVLPPPQALLA